MPLVLAFDTETTGLPFWNLPSEDPSQPHIVEVSAVLADTETRQVVEEFDTLIRPDSWVIPPEMTAIHGVTMDQALDIGIPERDAVLRLVELWRRAEYRVAHNESFDARMVRIALKRCGLDALADEWQEGRAYCTKRLSTKICNLPPTDKMMAAGRKTAKDPTVAEAFHFFTGRTLDGAHESLEDTRACLAVFFGILDHHGGVLPAAAPKAPRQAPASRPARLAAAAVTVAADDDGVGFLSR